MLITNKHYRQNLKNKKRIVIKVGSSSLVHPETGETDLLKLEQLVRVLCDLRNQGKDVVLVSSGAIGVGRKALGLNERPKELAQKQACASVGQGMLMMIYQKLFNEYSHVASQILMTKHTIVREKSLHNARNTFNELLKMGVIPIVNENDTVSTDEIEIGDNKDALFIECVTDIDDSLYEIAKGAGSDYGTGGMKTKIDAARIANDAGCDMIIANGKDFHVIDDIMKGQEKGTLFLAHKSEKFNILDYIEPEKIINGGEEEIHDYRC